ncbi:hypothetical protein ACHAWF_000510 [Thalassiosira exigua]
MLRRVVSISTSVRGLQSDERRSSARRAGLWDGAGSDVGRSHREFDCVRISDMFGPGSGSEGMRPSPLREDSCDVRRALRSSLGALYSAAPDFRPCATLGSHFTTDARLPAVAPVRGERPFASGEVAKRICGFGFFPRVRMRREEVRPMRFARRAPRAPRRSRSTPVL